MLDEIGELPESHQVHLLRVLDSDGQYHRLGEGAARVSDFRLIGATNRAPRSLKPDVLARFRNRVQIPGLNERRSEIPFLIRELVARAARRSPALAARFLHDDHVRIHPHLVDALLRHPYREHTRELDRLLGISIETSRGNYLLLTREVQDELTRAGRTTPTPPPSPTALPPPPSDIDSAGASASSEPSEEKIGNEIFELQEAVHAAHAAYLLTVQAAAEAPMERAQFVLGELRAALTFLFDDDTQDDDDARLERLAAYDGAFSQDDLAAALDAYATYAAQHRDSLAGLSGFDASVIDEAPALAKRLRDRSAEKLVSTPGGEERTALDLRNRLAALLWDRMTRVRSVTRYVFRNQPELIRKVTSTYERRRRSQTKRAKAEAEPTEA